MVLQTPAGDVQVRDVQVRDVQVRDVPVVGVPTSGKIPRAVPGGAPRSTLPARVDVLVTALERAQDAIHEAALTPGDPERYLAAHLAAQQVAGVVLAAKGARLGAGPCDPWGAVALVAPGCGEWAGYFSALQPKRRAVAAGVRAIVGEREADDLVRDAQGFHDHVLDSLRRCLHRTAAPARAAGS